MPIPLRVLIVEDLEDDVVLLLRQLRKGGYEPSYIQVQTAEAMTAALESQEWDIVLSDHTMPQFSSSAALALLQERAGELPFIIVSGFIGEDHAVAAMKAGAHDYVMKRNLTRLVPAVERALREADERRQRRRAEAALAESESILRSFFDSPGVMRSIVELAGEDILHIADNLAASSFYKMAAEATEHPMESKTTFPKELARLWIEHSRESMRTGAPSEFECFQPIGSKAFWLHGRVACLSATASGLPRFSYELTDVSERKRTEEELQKYDRLRHLESLRDSLVHMVVHDLRIPLSAITGSLELLRTTTTGDSDPETFETIEVLDRSVQTLNDMVSQLLDISRFESAQMPLHKVECDLVEVTRAAVKSLGVLTEGRHLEIIPAEKCNTLCDEDIVRRIFVNLLGNALKFTPAGGKVTVTIVAAGDFIRCSVSDTGPGIPLEHHKRIFDKFGQVESRSRRIGVGLGLAFCKLATEAHGGSIGVDSEAGSGSTFWFTLPAHP